MYAAPAGLTALPVTGLAISTGHYVLAAITLLFFGACMLRLIPRREA